LFSCAGILLSRGGYFGNEYSETIATQEENVEKSSDTMKSRVHKNRCGDGIGKASVQLKLVLLTAYQV